ncbi:MAG TPA: M14 family metallopeptidase [Chitinophagaceae bacterium]|nr:M14 family metallopeptidase [Chitinophagaceae bacterium]
MKKRFLFLAFTLFTFSITKAQLKSPDEFLGYKIGTKFTPHWKVVNYFTHVASSASAMIKLQQYGETNEGRPLLLAFVSSPENIQRLEQIRMNNIRLANLANDKKAAIEDNAPAVVWLSYNVHGNEASSTEAALLTLYALVDPSNTQTKEWLKNTVVILDPCINPDGRDRYVNWFNSIVGKNFNPQLAAREHREPWPGGRTNHYNFDLNRDWAWQTQKESRERMKLYCQWMPQVHVDYHEQSVNAPYYFAPAGQPYHEVITQWQRDFQVTIGKNNAKYFDTNGWLFFTKEVFDLFYPSYGDTYPVFNGSIGMTYEQAGGPAGGLGALNDEGDTLTLVDRATHHFITSLSTIEISSLNASKLVKEFRKYFNDAVSNGVGEHKSYVIKSDGRSLQRIKSLTELLDKNGIQYEFALGSSKGAFSGYDYGTGKEGLFTIQQGDLIVSALQPRSALVKVLFEPKSKLVDSVTYDITAWSLPYVYGVNAFASKDKIQMGGGSLTAAKISNPETDYGYVLPWSGMTSVKTVSLLLKKGILLRYAEQPFEIGSNKFDRGSIIILKTANKSFGKNLWSIVKEIADANNLQLFPVVSGFVDKGYDFGSQKVHPFKAPRVALVTGENVNSNASGEIWHFFEQQIDYPLTLINATNIGTTNWNNIDVLILPDGNYHFLSDKGQLEDFKDWINKGGKVIALEGAVAQLAKAEFGIKLKKGDEGDKKDTVLYAALKKFEDRERDAIPGTTLGSILKVNLDNTHPLAFGYPDYYFTLKQDDAIYEFMKEGWNVGVIKKESQVAGFIGAKLKEKLKDGLLFGVQNMGRGSVIYLADNVMFRSFWENGKLMFCNAVFLVGN